MMNGRNRVNGLNFHHNKFLDQQVDSMSKIELNASVYHGKSDLCS